MLCLQLCFVLVCLVCLVLVCLLCFALQRLTASFVWFLTFNLLASDWLEVTRFMLGLFGFLLAELIFFCFALLALLFWFAWFG